MIWRRSHTVAVVVGAVLWVLIWFCAAAIIWSVFGR